MKITFRLRFSTRYGESLLLTGNHELFGNGDAAHAIPLGYLNQEFWETTLVFSKGGAPNTDITYNYILRGVDGSLLYDTGKDRLINAAAIQEEEFLIIDSWNSPASYENAFYTEPFKDVLLRNLKTEVKVPTPGQFTHTFRIKVPLLHPNQTLCLLGNCAALGNWHTSKPILLRRDPAVDFLSAEIDLAKEAFPIQYKYGVYDMKSRTFLAYEEGENRVLQDTIASGKKTLVNDGFARLPASTWKGAGVAIPVFSLRSEKSFGIGEFTDLKWLADWAKQVGLKLIQILPVNDTTASHTKADSYPYSAISAFALNPVYLNLSETVTPENRSLLQELEGERQRLNKLDALDYEAVAKAKFDFLKRIYPQQRDETFAKSDYQEFLQKNKPWLEPYAAFCFLRDRYGSTVYEQWPQHRRYNPKEAEALAHAKNGKSSENERGESVGINRLDPAAQRSEPKLIRRFGGEEFAAGVSLTAVAESESSAEAAEEHEETDLHFHYFVQYHLHRQLKEASEYARSKGVILKGDLPIGVSRCGADTWQNPELYNLDMQAGAPPDAFAVKGQNWGFPTYNWERMKEDGFAWWRHRFEQMGNYFDAFRIDHILGFFRIWSAPSHAVEGIMGYFVPALPVHVHEFAQRGIPFDRDRFTRPHITDKVLRERFGTEDEVVKMGFLDSEGAGKYSLKKDFETQRQVERHFAELEQNDYHTLLRDGLYDLISNVLLFEASESNGQAFHFRFAIESTSSFRDLDAGTQAKLRDLYIDYFFRRQEQFWRQQGMEKLPALKRATEMLVCGEDLGLVPACVPEVMKQLGLLSLEVQRMPKELNREFSRPKDAPYLSVVTPSTHDMSTIRGWWEEDPVRTQRFFNEELGEPGVAPETCEGWINKAIVLQHLASPAMWSIFQLQDLLGMDEQLRRKKPQDERINIPADSKNYWRYRMHFPLEKLLQADRFNEELRACVQQAGR